MEAIVERDNLRKALARVKRNKGAPGIDGMTVEDLSAHLKEHWPTIRAQLLDGTYQPQPVRRVEIPKPVGRHAAARHPDGAGPLHPAGGACRCCRPTGTGRSPTQATAFGPGARRIRRWSGRRRISRRGRDVVVDIDLEKFFDRVNHDILMGRVAQRVNDKRMLKLIRGFLTAGVMEDGLVSPTEEGTPQGGPLSPLLSNMMLDELDKELEKRGHRFCATPTTATSMCAARRAGERVMASVDRFLDRALKLKVNKAKSAVAQPSDASSWASASRAASNRGA